MNGVRIEDASLERDLDAITAIARDSFPQPWTREMFHRELSETRLSRSYVARTEQGEVVAFATCWLIVDELHINTVAVRRDVRRHGFARALMEHVLAEAAARGAQRALLEVRRSNLAAIGLYDALGFTTESVRKGYYPNPPDDALILSKKLRGSP